MPIDEWAKSFPTNNYILNVEMAQKECPIHRNELLDISCKTCHVMICYRCCLGAHQICEKTLTKYNANKIKNDLINRRDTLKVRWEPNEKRLVKLEEEDLTGEQIKPKIKEMVETLSTFIGKQRKRWLEEIETARLKEMPALQKRKDNIYKHMQNIKENMNDIESFIGEDEEDAGGDSAPRMQRNYDYQPKHSFASMGSDFDQLEEEWVNFEINKKFVKIMDEMLTETIVDKIPVPGTTSSAMNQSESRLFLREICSLSERHLVINDMVILPDNSVLIAEAGLKKIGKFSATGQCLRNAYCNSEPFGLCILRHDCVAVSQPSEKTINIFNCENLTEIERFSFGKCYYGLASDENARIFSLYCDIDIGNITMCVDIISKDNPESPYEIIHIVNLPASIYTCNNYRLRVIPYSSHVIIINSINSLNVTCISLNGTVVFKYEGVSDDRLFSVADVAVGRDFIFIADKIANKIHRIQHEGNFVDIPLTLDDCISNPIKIFVSNEDVLAILSQTYQTPKIQFFSN